MTTKGNKSVMVLLPFNFDLTDGGRILNTFFKEQGVGCIKEVYFAKEDTD